MVREYAALKLSVETNTETLSFTSESDTAPGSADDQMNQYTTMPGEALARSYYENGNIVYTGTALPTRFRHDYLDRIVEARTVPAVESVNGVPVGD